MKRIRKIFAALLALSICIGVTACSAKTDTATPSAAASAAAESTTSKSGTYKIGVLMKTMSDTYSNKLGEAIKAYAAKTYPDVELYLVDAQADINKQIAQAEDLIAKKVNVIVLNAQDADGSAQVLTLAKDANIPVVEVNTRTNSEDFKAYVGSNDEEAGQIMGKYVLEKLGNKGDVALLEGNMGQSAQILRRKGLDSTILANKDIKLVAELSADWARDKAMSTTEDWLGKYKNLKAVLCENDDMAMGALEAAEAAGRKDLVIVGVDAIPDALQAVSDGRLSGTVLQDAAGQASKSMDVAYKVAKGESVEKENIVPFQLITKDNVAKFLGK